jgi:hypothetical protein
MQPKRYRMYNKGNPDMVRKWLLSAKKQRDLDVF